MNLNNSIKELQELLKARVCTVTPGMEIFREFNYKHAKKQCALEGKSCSIFDQSEGRFTFHMSAHEKWMPVPVINIEAVNNYENICNLTHPHDLPKVIENELKGFNFLQQLEPGKKEYFQLLYMRRLMDKNGHYQLYLHRVSVLQPDACGESYLLLFCTEKLPGCFTDLSLIRDFYLIFPLPLPDRKKRAVFVNNVWITEQELNILQMVYDGKEQTEIADRYNVSVNTVKTHFRTIRKKLNIKNIQMAAEFAKLTGILY